MLCAAAAEAERGEARNEARDERERTRETSESGEKVNGREEEKDVWRSWHGEVPCAAAERRNVRWEMIGRTTTHTNNKIDYTRTYSHRRRRSVTGAWGLKPHKFLQNT